MEPDDHCADSLFGSSKYDIGGLRAILDGIPERVKEFEEERKKTSSAIAYLSVNNLFYDDDIKDESIRRQLRTLHQAEWDSQADMVRKPFEFLETKVKSESKKEKIRRLAAYDKKFMEHIKAQAEGRDYVDTLPQNQSVTEDLKTLGVDTEIFYNGIPERSFAIQSGKKIDKEEIKKAALAEYRTSLDQLLGEGAVHGPERLEQKIRDSLAKEGKKLPEEQKTRDYLLATEDEGELRKICAIASDYASQRQNIKDAQAAGAAVHHLRSVNRSLKGESTNGNGVEQSVIYRIKIASKNPFTDVDIGNDGGCCIGVYGEDDDSREWTVENFIDHLKQNGLDAVGPNGCYMPFYLKDRATHFAEIYKGQDRVGMALMFAGRTDEGESALAINSIEMSEKLRNDLNRETVTQEAMAYLKQYASAAGFKHAVLGDHDYNPARQTGEAPNFGRFTKIDYWGEQFYSDILSGANDSASSERFTIL